MRSDWSHLEANRKLSRPLESRSGERFGAFTFNRGSECYIIIADDGETSGWEHVSMRVALRSKERTPRWDEMVWLKNLFWEEEETVLQFHPPKSQYVNCHPHVLHLWRQVGVNATTPPTILIGPNLKRDLNGKPDAPTA